MGDFFVSDHRVEESSASIGADYFFLRVPNVMDDQVNVVLHDLKLRDPGVVVGLLGGLSESVAHNRDEHVEEDYLDQERGAKEENVAEDSRAAIRSECVDFELAQA